MSRIRSRSKRVCLATAVTAAGIASPLFAQTPSSWTTATSGAWTDPARWSTFPDYPNNGTPPGSTYAATVAAAGSPYTVGLSSDVTVSSFTLNSPDATLAHSAGTFDAGSVSLLAGSYAALGGTLRASSITGPAGLNVNGPFTLDLGSPSATGTIGTAISAAAGSALTVAGAWTNAGSISVTGGSLTLAGTPAAALGTIALANSTLNVATVLTTAQVASVSLNNSDVRVVTNGAVNNTSATIALSPTNPSWTLAGGTIGGGAITSTGGAKLLLAPGTASTLSFTALSAPVDVPANTTLSLSSGITNTGLITVQNGGTLRLIGSPATANLGTIRNTAGGTVAIVGFLNNGGATLNLDANTGPWTLLPNAAVANGTVAGTAPNNLVALGGTLTAVTVAGDVSVGDGVTAAASLSTSNVSFTPGGRFTVKSPAGTTDVGVLATGVSPTYNGAGEIVFDGPGDGGFVRPATGGQSITFGPAFTVRTGAAGGSVASASTAARNNGLLSAQTPDRTLSVLGALNNQGTAESRNGSTLSFAVNPSNLSGTTLTGGTWAVYDSASIAFPLTASITTNAATVTLSGATSSFAAINPLATNSGTLNLAGGKRFTTASNLANSGTISVASSSTLKVTGTLTNTGKVDLAGGTLVLDYTGATPAASLRAQLATGRAGGSWTGATGVTSSTAAADPQLRLAVGYAEAAALDVTTYAGVDVDSTAVVTKITYYGDANLDGRVDADDYALIDRGFAMNRTDWVNGDFDYSGSVNGADYLLVDRVFAQQGGTLSPSLLAARESQFGPGYAAALLVAIPEPSAVLLLAAGLPLVTRRRRTP